MNIVKLEFIPGVAVVALDILDERSRRITN